LKRFEKVSTRSLEAITLWKDILNLSRHRPAPFAAFDAFIHMAPIVTLRGTRWAVGYYQKLKKELEERVRKGEGAFAREEIRLIWDNIPIWYDIRNLSKMLSGQGAVLVADTYTWAWNTKFVKWPTWCKTIRRMALSCIPTAVAKPIPWGNSISKERSRRLPASPA
jgi:benzoyl-CoA reductase/2-hydroxyglutaryl-CoA dehydratase subunit BcrC/BadD/HgdB